MNLSLDELYRIIGAKEVVNVALVAQVSELQQKNKDLEAQIIKLSALVEKVSE